MSSKLNPDFQELRKVLLRQGISDRVILYEHYVDSEVIEKIMEIPITNLDLTKKEEKEKYLKVIIEFYYKFGYDYVPLRIEPDLPRENFLFGNDTAELSRQKRQWQDENTGPIASWEEFEKYRWPKNDAILDYSYFEFVSKNLPDGMKIVGHIGGGVFELTSWLMGLVPMSYALYEQPDLVQAIVDKVGEMISIADTNIIKICDDKIGALRMGDDLGYKTSTMLPPDMLRKYIFPWQKKIVEIAHQNNLPFILHSCGNLKDIMDDLIEYVKIDAKHSYEDVIMPVIEAKQKYGNRIAILGGVDIDKLSRWDEQDIRKYVREILDKCVPGGGYALGSGNTISNYVKIENYLAMLDEGKKWFVKNGGRSSNIS